MNHEKFKRLAAANGLTNPGQVAKAFDISRQTASILFEPPSKKLFSIGDESARRVLSGLGLAPDKYWALFAEGDVEFRNPQLRTIGRNNYVRDPEHDVPGARKRAARHSGRICTECFIELPTGAPADETLCDDCK